MKQTVSTTVRKIEVQRFGVTSSKPFQAVLASLQSAIGRPDMSEFGRDVASATTYNDLEQVVNQAVGSSGLMEFMRLDLGDVLRKERGPQAPKALRLIVGNPLIMKEMLEHVPDAGSYAPVTILIDERPDGVHLSYDRMASFLSAYQNEEALKVARDLDSKVEALLTAATADR
jgi:uncharacterized protein (DUF302 family)